MPRSTRCALDATVRPFSALETREARTGIGSLRCATTGSSATRSAAAPTSGRSPGVPAQADAGRRRAFHITPELGIWSSAS
jgi:hypothetical protein